MPYGQGSMLGASVDPRLFVQDYSGIVDAANMRAKGINDLGNNIVQGIEKVGDYFKGQEEKKKLIKKSDIQIDAALKLFPDLAPTLQGVRDQIKDQNIPLDERAGIAESVAGLIDMGTNQMRANAQSGIEERKLKIMEGDARARRIQDALPAPSDWKPIDKEISINGQPVKVVGYVDQNGQFKDIENNTYPSIMSAFGQGDSNASTNSTNPGSYSQPSTTGINVDGGPGVLPLRGDSSTTSNGDVPNPPSTIDYNQIPRLPGDPISLEPTNFDATGAPVETNATVTPAVTNTAVAPSIIRNIEQAGNLPTSSDANVMRIPPGSSIVTGKLLSPEEQRLQDLKTQNEELNIAQKKQEVAKALGDEAATKQAAIDEKNASISAMENTYKQLVEAKNSPGIKGAFGIPAFRVIPGTDESVARVSVDQIASNAWLNSIIDARSKGARFGSLSNSEGERLAVATSKLAQASNLSYEAGNKEIQNMIESLKTSYKRLSGKELAMPEGPKTPASRIGLAQDNFNNANFGIRTY